MKMIKVTDYGFRRVVLVVLNPNDPQWLHPDGKSAPARHTGNTEETNKQICQDCRNNWTIEEFTFTRDELLVGLNKWGNPVHDGQAIVSTRPKTWDELYQEIDDTFGEHVVFGDAPRKAPPAPASELDPEFELVPTGNPYMEDDLAKQRYKLLHFGLSRATIIVEGETRLAFATDLESQYLEAQAHISAEAANAKTAAAIVL